jgi:hypothetical protein
MRIIAEAQFRRNMKHLVKKYPSLTSDYAALLQSLEGEPMQGTPLGRNCFKIRMAIGSKNAGKSGGARVITCVRILNDTVHLLTIYDKSEMDTINDALLKKLIEGIEDNE